MILLNNIHMYPRPRAPQVQEPGSARPRTCNGAVCPSYRPGVFILAPCTGLSSAPTLTRSAPLLLVVLLYDLYSMYYSPAVTQLLKFAGIEIFSASRSIYWLGLSQHPHPVVSAMLTRCVCWICLSFCLVHIILLHVRQEFAFPLYDIRRMFY
jgi:hypothetical protein